MVAFVNEFFYLFGNTVRNFMWKTWSLSDRGMMSKKYSGCVAYKLRKLLATWMAVSTSSDPPRSSFLYKRSQTGCPTGNGVKLS